MHGVNLAPCLPWAYGLQPGFRFKAGFDLPTVLPGWSWNLERKTLIWVSGQRLPQFTGMVFLTSACIAWLPRDQKLLAVCCCEPHTLTGDTSQHGQMHVVDTKPQRSLPASLPLQEGISSLAAAGPPGQNQGDLVRDALRWASFHFLLIFLSPQDKHGYLGGKEGKYHPLAINAGFG